MIESTRLPNRLGAILVLLIVTALANSVQAGDSVWVRVHHAADTPALQGFAAVDSLRDYGSFQWGQVSRSELQAMQAAGLSVSASDNPFLLDLGGETFDPLDQASMSARFQPYQADPRGDFHLIQFQGPVRAEWLEQARASGMELVQYIHPFSYVVWADGISLSAARSMPEIRWAGDFLPEFRVIPEQRGFGPANEPTNILVSRHVNLRSLQSEMRSLGASILNVTPYLGHFQILEVSAPGNRYMDLGRMAGVYTIQQAIPMMSRGEMSNQAITNSNFTSNQNTVPGYADWLAATGYDGDGVIVSIIDGGIRTSHQDIVGQMSPCVSQGSPTSCTTGNDSHGTHVAGAVAGSGASGTTDAGGFLRGQGVAPGARLVQQRYASSGLAYNFGSTCTSPTGPYCTTPSGMLVLFREAQLSGALLANNSWGSSGIKIGYDIASQQVDVVTRDANPDLPGAQPVLPVWSVMNGGGTVSGACNNNSLGAPDEAKNLFAVGSSQLIPGSFPGGTVVPNPSNFFNVSGNSAHGPACDGRVGVHIVAPGCATDAPTAGSDSAYSAGFCGTSMASPVVSGALAVFIERYRDLFAADPSPAMMKAAMMGVAINMHGNQGANGQTITQTPSGIQGYGRVDLDAAVNPPYEVMYFDQETVFTSVGQDWTMRLVADDPTEPVRVMLVWTDAHGSGLAGSTPAWVNLLDLVVDADTGSYLGNQIGSDGFSQTGGTPDPRNNMEAVFLRPNQHNGAVFDVTVNAANIVADALNPHSPGSPQQDFALVCYNCLFGEDTFTLSLSETALGVCLPDSGSDDQLINVSVGALADYVGTVELSTAGVPAGVSSSIDPSSVAAPGSASWTLGISDSAAAGSYLLELIGDDGDESKSAELALLLDAFLADGPGLTSPANAATDVSLTPGFAWNAQGGAADYRFQLASDSSFDTILIDEVLDETSFVPASELDTGTEYFWRVSGNNLCGQGDWSPTFSFTTRLEPVAEFSAEEFSLEVPQNGGGSVELLISNTGTGNLVWSAATDQIDASAAGSRFSGYFDPSNWDLVNTPSGVGGSVAVAMGPPVEVVVTGGAGNGGGDTDLQIEIPADGTIHFDWGYQSTDTDEWDRGGFVVNGAFTVLAFNNTQVPFFNESRSVEVSEGDLFAFRVNTTDGLFGAGNLGITNFVFEIGVCGDELSPVDWLSISPTSGSVPADDSEAVTISVNTAGLAEGEYEGYICITTNAANAGMTPIQVNLTVTEQVLDPPQIEVEPTTLSLILDEGEQDALSFEIGNAGEADLVWQLDQSEAQCELPAWLGVDPAGGSVAGGDDQTVTVSFDADAVDPGSYQATICLVSNDPDSPLVEVEVSLQVNATIAFLEGTVQSLGYCQEDPSPANAVLVQVVGQNGSFSTTTNASGEFQLSMDAEEGPVTVTFSRAQHRPLTEADVALVAGEVSTLDVGLVLRERCARTEPETLAFSLISGQSDSSVLVLSNALGGEDLTWSLASGDGCFDPTLDDWISLSPSSGLIGWGNVRNITVSVNSEGLAQDLYEAAICLQTNDAQATELVVPLEMQVLDASIFQDRFEGDPEPEG